MEDLGHTARPPLVAVLPGSVPASPIFPRWSEVHVTIPLSLRTRNYVGTIFGGSMFSGTDPLFMLMASFGRPNLHLGVD